MTLYAIGQQTIAAAPNVAYPGDLYGLPGIAGSVNQSFGALAASALTIGTFGWVVNGLSGQYTNSQVTQVQGSNTIPVFIPRNNSSVYSNADINQGWSATVPVGYELSVYTKGSFYAVVTISYNSGSVINVGDAVFINTTTGTLAVGVTVQTPFVQSDFVVVNNNITNTFGVSLVSISNIGAI